MTADLGTIDGAWSENVCCSIAKSGTRRFDQASRPGGGTGVLNHPADGQRITRIRSTSWTEMPRKVLDYAATICDLRVYGMAASGAKRPFIDKQQVIFLDKWFSNRR